MGALLVSAVLALLLSTTRLMAWIGTRTDVDSSGLLGLNMLSADLREASYTSLTIAAGPPIALSFLRQDPTTSQVGSYQPESDGAGHLQFTVYYLNTSKNTLVRKTWNQTQNPLDLSPDPDTTQVLAAPQLTLVASSVNGTERPVASHVVSMKCTPATYPTTSPTEGVEVQLGIQATATTGQTCIETVDTLVCPRNHP